MKVVQEIGSKIVSAIRFCLMLGCAFGLAEVRADAVYGLVDAVMASSTPGEEVMPFRGDMSGVVKVGTGSADKSLQCGNSTGIAVSRGAGDWAPETVYQRERYVGGCDADNRYGVKYVFRNLVSGATYKVEYFGAETWYTAAGNRVFNLLINDEVVQESFELPPAGAGRSSTTATTRSWEAKADANGEISFTCAFGTKENAKYGGLAISGTAAPSNFDLVSMTMEGKVVRAYCTATDAHACYLEKSTTSADGPWTTVARTLRSDNGKGFTMTDGHAVGAKLWYRVVCSNGVGTVTGAVTSFTSEKMLAYALAVGVRGKAFGDYAEYDHLTTDDLPFGRTIDSVSGVGALVDAPPEDLFKSCLEAPTLTFDLPNLKPAKPYELTLYFNDPDSAAAGERVMSVGVNGETKADSLDVFAAAGAKNTAFAWSCEGLAPDAQGNLKVSIAGVTGRAILSGLKLVEANSDMVPLKPSVRGPWRISGGVLLAVGSLTANATYEIRRKAAGASEYETLASACTGEWLDVAADGTAVYSVRAKDSAGNWSDWTADFAVAATSLKSGVRVAGIGAGNVSDGYESYRNTVPTWLSTTHGGGTVSYPSVSFGLPASVVGKLWWVSNLSLLCHTFAGLVPGASYRVRIHRADDYYKTADSRYFSASVNGDPIFNHLDTAKYYGAQKGGVLEGVFRANHAGEIFVLATREKENQQFNAIEVVSESVRDSAGAFVRFTSGLNTKDEAYRSTETTSQIALDWRGGAPDGVSSTGNAAEWSGWLTVPETATYQFKFVGTGTMTLTIDDRSYARRTVSEGSPAPVVVALAAGVHRLRFHYEQAGEAAHAELKWSSTSLPEQVVAGAYLTRDDGAFGLLDGDWNVHASGDLPSGGDVYTVGLSDEGTKVWRLVSCGTDFFGSEENYIGAWRKIKGEVDVRIRVKSVPTMLHCTKVGLQLRTDMGALQGDNVLGISFANQLAGNAPLRPSCGIETVWGDFTEKKYINTSMDVSQIYAPTWLRMTRKRVSGGYLLESFYSADGETWTPVRSMTVSGHREMYAGIHFCGHSGTAQVAEIDNVSFSETIPGLVIIFR